MIADGNRVPEQSKSKSAQRARWPKKMKKKRDNFSATITSNHALSFFIQDVVHELVQDVVHELIIQDNNNNEQVVYLDGKL